MPAHMNENCVKHMSLLAGMTQRQQECVTELTNKLEQGQKMLDDIRSENEKLKSELQRTTQESETLRAEKAEVTEKQKAARSHQDIADLREEIFTTLKREKQNLEQKREEKVAMLEVGTKQLRQEISALKVASKQNTVSLKQDILRRESVSKEETEQMKQVVEELRLEAASKRQEIDELRQVNEELGEMKRKVDELKKKEKEAGILRYEVSQIKQKQEESMIERETLRQESDGIKKEIMELAQHSKTCISHIETKQEQNKFSIELTMPNFSKHKKANDRWSSHPFYTNPHRYKLCLDVYANGFGDCKGTHVSVYARLVQGEFDDHLEWPFQGDIVVQLLNQLDEDKHPHEAAISFSSENGDEILSTVAGRVTTAEQSRSGWGYDDFISQDVLGYSQAEVCQYLRDDCLTFRVMRARPLDLIQEITALKENVEQLQREKQLACELQPYSSLLVDYVDSKGKSISWQDIGIMIDVPPGSTSEDNPVIRVQAQCFLPGPDLSVVLPENVQLASPVYRISATSKFSKKVELSIAHFATMDSKDDMTFLHSSDRSPPYRFQLVPGGTFIPHGTCGTLLLSKFSKYATGRRKRTASERGEGTPNSAKRREESGCKYVAFFNSPLEESQQHRWYAVFSVSLYHPAFITNFRSELKATFPDVHFLESFQFVQLSGDMVELLIPSTDAQEQGYTVESDRHCQISYEEIHIPDQFPSVSDLPMYPPRLRLTIECCDSKGPLKNLECKLVVKGTKKPCYFKLKMKAPSSEGVFDSTPGMMQWFTRQFSRSSGSVSSTSSISLEESRRGPSRTTPTLQELSSSVVARVTPKWHPLGIQLGLDPAFLQKLEINYRDSQRHCTEMFRQWLMQPELNPSWDKLIQALNSSSIAQRDLARELSEKYSVTS